MKTVCIFHGCDLDGWMSAAIVKHWWNNMPEMKSAEDVIDFIGFNYGDPIPDLSQYDRVIMCDISFTYDVMELISTKLIWIDHHISAINMMDKSESFKSNVVKRFTQTNYAACELTWMYFFPEQTMPEIVRLLGRYDCFGHKGTPEEQKVLEFQYGARQCISNYEEAYSKLIENIEEDNDGVSTEEGIVGQIWFEGQSIYAYLCTDAKQSCKNGFEIKFEYPDDGKEMGIGEVKFICINKERFNPINFNINYHDPTVSPDGKSYDGVACFHITSDKMVSFSLYNDNGQIDCSAIAKQYGGGGHRGASGMIVDEKTFLKIING